MPRDFFCFLCKFLQGKILALTAFSGWWHTEQQQGHVSLVTLGRYEVGTSTDELCQQLPKKAGKASGGRKEESFEVEDKGEREQPPELEQEQSWLPQCCFIGLFIQHATEGTSFTVGSKQERPQHSVSSFLIRLPFTFLSRFSQSTGCKCWLPQSQAERAHTHTCPCILIIHQLAQLFLTAFPLVYPCCFTVMIGFLLS